MIRIPEMPPYSDNFVTQDKQPFSQGKYHLLKLMGEHFNAAVDALNNVNGGIPAGFKSLSEATRVSRPSKEAYEARRKVCSTQITHILYV